MGPRDYLGSLDQNQIILEALFHLWGLAASVPGLEGPMQNFFAEPLLVISVPYYR